MNKDILIVDDNAGAITTYAQLVEARIGFSPFVTSDPKAALDIIRNNTIKVVVLDQRMPLMKGTELFKEIKKTNIRIQGMMLTAEASATEVGEALQIGFSSYLDKSDIGKLPDVILDLLAKYEAVNDQALIDNGHEPFLIQRKGFLGSIKLLYYMKHTELIDDSYIFENKWKTIIAIDSGTVLKHKESMEIKTEIMYEDKIETSLTSDFGMDYKKLGEFKAKLETQLKYSFSERFIRTESQKFEIEKEYSLDKNSVNENGHRIISRHYLIAPCYNRYRVIVKISCPISGMEEMKSFDIFQESNRFKTKQIEYYDNGGKKEIDTGTIYK